MVLSPTEIDNRVRPVLTELIKAVRVEGNLLHSLRVTPTGESVVFYVASINAATKVHTGKEKVLLLEKDAETIENLAKFCEDFVKPVGFTMEGETYHWFFFPDIENTED